MKKKNAKQTNFALRKLSAAENKQFIADSLSVQTESTNSNYKLSSLVTSIISNENPEQNPTIAAEKDVVEEAIAETTEQENNFESSKLPELSENQEQQQTAVSISKVHSYSARIANLRQTLQGKASRKDAKLATKQLNIRKIDVPVEINAQTTSELEARETANSLLTALNGEANAEIAKALANFKIPEKISERCDLARKLHLIPETHPKRCFRLAKLPDAHQPKLSAIEALEKLETSRQLINAASQQRRLLATKAYRQISDDMFTEAYAHYLKNGEHKFTSETKFNNVKLAANRRRQARLKLANEHKSERVKALFKRKFNFKNREKKTIHHLKHTWEFVNKFIRRLRISATVITLIVGVCLSLVALLPIFYLENIQIDGNIHLSKAELTDFLKVQKGQHLITLLKGNIWQIIQGRNVELERQLQENYPIISQVKCTVKIPGTLQLKIKESTTIACLKVPGGYANIDAKGRILSIGLGDPGDAVPLIKGLDTNYVQVNQLFTEIKERSFTNAIVFMDNLMRSDFNYTDQLKLMLALRTITLMPDASLWIEFNFTQANKILPTTSSNSATNVAQLSAVNNDDSLLVHIGADISDYANLIYWLRNTKQVGALDNLGSGYLDLTHKQKVFVKSVDNAETPSQKGRLKAEPWDNSAWTWKDIVVKSFKKKVGD